MIPGGITKVIKWLIGLFNNNLLHRGNSITSPNLKQIDTCCPSRNVNRSQTLIYFTPLPNHYTPAIRNGNRIGFSFHFVLNLYIDSG